MSIQKPWRNKAAQLRLRLKLSAEFHSEHLISRSSILGVLLCLLLNASNYAQEANRLIESVGKLPDSTQYDSLIQLAMPRLMAQSEIAGVLLARAEELALKQSDSLKWAAALTMHGFTMPDSQSMTALSYYQSAIPILRKNQHRFQVQALANAAEILTLLGEYNTSIQYQLWALDYVISIENQGQTIALTTNIGYFYDRIEDYERASVWQKKALHLAEEAKDTFMLGLIAMRQGLIMDKSTPRNADSAEYFLKKAEGFFSKNNDQLRLAQVHGNLGNVYLKSGRLNEAMSELKLASKINRTQNRQHSLTINIINIGRVLSELGEYSQARDSLKAGLNWAKLVGDQTFQLDALYDLHICMQNMGETEQAIQYLNRYSELRDSVFSIERDKQVSNLRVRYQTLQKEKAIMDLESKNSISELELTEQRYRVFLLSVGILLIMIVAIGAMLMFRQKQRNFLQKREIEYGEKLLNVQVQSQEDERQRIAKELHDGIAQTLVASKLQLQKTLKSSKSISKKDESTFTVGLKSLDDACHEIRQISHQMMPRSLVELGLISAIEDLLHKSLSPIDIKHTFEHSGVENQQLVQRVEIALFRICQELINNVVKHSGASHVHVQLYKTKTHIILMVEDDGKGFPSTSSDGIGMSNINSRATAINGKISIEEGPEKGVVAVVKIPLSPA